MTWAQRLKRVISIDVTTCNLVREVVSVDFHADFVERAGSRLALAGFTIVKVGVANAASFDPGRRF
ncbi:hypothetical protein [Dokdonella sp.]|uniref:hypothetical protein n=1 Tax=Dokdonella sp. TaxID=2291710 RepID=UPI0025C3BFCC|nr:hypothetical protein [Dokdonella sp.]MBX3690979.1 hypothetical protein [Dokdonella sp.]MCW5567464.1 hypothetical protein [Dokdonella sp.]